MAADARSRMIEGAATLLSRRGVQAASFGEVIKLTGAPRGSIYHHFPGGKDQLIEAAIDLLGENAFAPIERYAGAPAAIVAKEVLAVWRRYLAGSELQAGCVILAVTVTSDSPKLIAQAAAVFRSWRKRLAVLFELGGMSHDRAEGFAAVLIASIEGATVISRAQGNLEPFDVVAAELLDQLASENYRGANLKLNTADAPK